MLKNISLIESIIHIEDLPPRDFIREIKTLHEKIITEKLDGANLWFGVDEKGFFTSREGKNSKQKRFYDVSDYPVIANYNGFRAAHLALEKAKKIILKYFQAGDMAEIEVVFGQQPNTVSYEAGDKNYIVILRPVVGTDEEKVKRLSSALNGQEVTVTSTVLSSIDGSTLLSNDQQLRWKFTGVKPIKDLNIDAIGVRKLIDELEKFLDAKNEKLPSMSNDEVANLSLNKIEKEKREDAKVERERLKKEILEKYKMPIKKILLDKLVKKIKPMINGAGGNVEDEIEGIVARDPKTDQQVKIVDRDVFTAINFFNSTVRAQVSGTIKTTDQDAPIELRGGAFGQAKIRIANILGQKDLALTSGMNKIVKRFKADSAQETAAKIAAGLNLQGFDSIKRKVEAILENSVKEINELLTTFKAEADKYVLKLKNGREVKFTPSVMNRTLTAFAETKQDISQIISSVKKADDAPGLIFALYGKTIEKSLSNKGNETVKEQKYTSFSLLKHVSEEGEGAAPSGGTAAPAGDSTGTAGEAEAEMSTRAGAIAPYPYRLLNGKVVIKRKKTFAPFKKFKRPGVMEQMYGHESLIKEMETNLMKQPQRDVEFNTMRNRLRTDSINALDVTNYLNKAHEINDEVDSIAFGLELDDGKIVKVYVDANQANDFEKALGEMLGKEDDIEDVINDMALKYNIVDVVWPENEEEEKLAQDQEVDINAPSDVSKDETSPDAAPEIDITINKPDVDDLDADRGEIDEPIEKPESGKFSNLRRLLDAEKEDAGKKRDDSEEDDAGKNDKKDVGQGKSSFKNLKKLIQKEEMDMSQIKNNFELILEAKKKAKKDDQPHYKNDDGNEETDGKSIDLQNMLKSFPAKQDKAIITLMVELGAPVKTLAVYSHLLRTTIDSAAERYLKNAAFRMWTKKLLTAIEKAKSVSESTSFDKRLQTKYQHMAYNILIEIGMPTNIEKIATKELLQGIKRISKLAIENSDVRLNLTAVAEELGVADKTHSMAEPIKEQLETSSEAMAKDALMGFFELFGIDTAKNISVEKQLDRSTSKMYVSRLSKSADNLQRLRTLTDRLKKLRMATESHDMEANDNVESSWIFAYLASSGFSLRSDKMAFKLDPEQAAAMKSSLESGEDAIITSKRGEDYKLMPLEDGSYSIAEVGNESNEDVLSAIEVQEILDLMNE